MDCKFCNKSFSSIYNLKYHQENTKYCLIIQGKNYICNYCNTELKNNKIYIEHLNNCLIIKLERSEMRSEEMRSEMRSEMRTYFSTYFMSLLHKIGNLTSYYTKQNMLFIQNNNNNNIDDFV